MWAKRKVAVRAVRDERRRWEVHPQHVQRLNKWRACCVRNLMQLPLPAVARAALFLLSPEVKMRTTPTA